MIPGVGRSNPITILGIHQIQCIKSDLRIWLKFLQGFNGVSYFPDSDWQDLNTLNFFTDNAGSYDLGFGVYFQGNWFFLPWPAGWENKKILKDMFLEMIPAVLPIEVWGLQLRNKKVVFNVDNIALVSIIK